MSYSPAQVMTPKNFLRWVSLNLMIKGHPVAALFCAEHIIAEFVVPENTCERLNARCRGTEELFFTKMTRLSLVYIYMLPTLYQRNVALYLAVYFIIH